MHLKYKWMKETKYYNELKQEKEDVHLQLKSYTDREFYFLPF